MGELWVGLFQFYMSCVFFKKTNTTNVTSLFFHKKYIYLLYDQLLLIMVMISSEYVQYLHLLELYCS